MQKMARFSVDISTHFGNYQLAASLKLHFFFQMFLTGHFTIWSWLRKGSLTTARCSRVIKAHGDIAFLFLQPLRLEKGSQMRRESLPAIFFSLQTNAAPMRQINWLMWYTLLIFLTCWIIQHYSRPSLWSNYKQHGW